MDKCERGVLANKVESLSKLRERVGVAGRDAAGRSGEFAREARVLGLLCRQEGKHEAALKLQQRARRLHQQARP